MNVPERNTSRQLDAVIGSQPRRMVRAPTCPKYGASEQEHSP